IGNPPASTQWRGFVASVIGTTGLNWQERNAVICAATHHILAIGTCVLGRGNLSRGRMGQQANMIYLASIWVIPLVIAITFHEAAHGIVARLLGDDTAWKLGRVSLNPAKHIDPFGTILLPGFLLLLSSPFLFGYAKPVPVNFRALRNPRSGMVWVAAAGPAMNIALAILAALAFHLVGYLPVAAAQWAAENLKNALIINVVLAVFNMF